MPTAPQGTGRRARAGRRTRLAACSLLAGLVAAPVAAQAGASVVPRLSGLPWGSGVNGPSADNAAFASWRGGRRLDVRTIFFGIQDWTHMASSARALSTALNGGTGRLVVAIGMLPKTHTGQLAQCAAGQFDPQIRAVTTNMLNNGAQTAANNGKPVIIRLGWEANNEGSYPWAATGDGSTWKNCFKRWVDILNPVAGSTRQKRFLIVWNMANRGTITYPIDNLWPGNDYVDIVGSQYYDRCSPLPDGDRYAFEARMDARTHSNNPAGPRAWLEYAKAKGKPWAMPEWGIGGPREGCAEPGTDNPYFIEKMYEFFWKNAAHIAFEAYFNDTGGADPAHGSHQIFVPDRSGTARARTPISTTRSATTRARPPSTARCGAPASSRPRPRPRRRRREPPPPPPASDELYWLRYIASYDDLITSIGPNAAQGHASFLATGRAQRRSAYFDPQAYLDRHPAWKEQFGTNLIAATRHFITYGYPRGHPHLLQRPAILAALHRQPCRADPQPRHPGDQGRGALPQHRQVGRPHRHLRCACLPQSQRRSPRHLRRPRPDLRHQVLHQQPALTPSPPPSPVRRRRCLPRRRRFPGGGAFPFPARQRKRLGLGRPRPAAGALTRTLARAQCARPHRLDTGIGTSKASTRYHLGAAKRRTPAALAANVGIHINLR